jgi:elongation factor Ts
VFKFKLSMLRNTPSVVAFALPRRTYSTPSKPQVKLVAELRKLTEVSIAKAREALTATNNDLNLALQWLQKDLAISGAKKAAKVDGRFAREGLISTCILSRGVGPQSGPGQGGVRGAMVELNCETDFVGRNDLFGRLAADIAHTAAFISDPVGSDIAFQACSLDMLNDAPLIPQLHPLSPPSATVGATIHDLIAKVGEKISLRRAVTLVENTRVGMGLRLASYNHGSIDLPSQGRIGSLALLALKSRRLDDLMALETFRVDLERLERSLARQIVGFETRWISSPSGEKDDTALYDQPFMMLPGESSGRTVREVLHNWAQENGIVEKIENFNTGGLAVLDFRKWVVGEAIE